MDREPLLRDLKLPLTEPSDWWQEAKVVCWVGAGLGRYLKKTLWQNGPNLISGLEQMSGTECVEPKKHT